MSRASRANALNAPPAPAEARAPVLPVLPSHVIAHTRDIVSARGDIRSHPTISRVALTITRVGTIPRPGHDIVRKRTILQRGPAISRAPTISRPAHDIAHTHDNTIAARYRTRVVISWAGSRYRAGTISWARPRYRGISRYRAPAQDNARFRKVLCPLTSHLLNELRENFNSGVTWLAVPTYYMYHYT
jgi:hypothetical protein